MGGIEFFVPEPGDTPVENKKIESEEASLDAALQPPPQVEIQMPTKAAPSAEELSMASRAIEDPDDPMVLLQRELGRLPGRGGKAADMAFRTDIALNNLGVTARRMADLEARKERRAKRKKR